MSGPAGLAERLATVEERIAAACRASGRPRQAVTLIAVTKTHPAAAVRAIHQLGVRDVGENREREAADKRAACADLDLRWHFIGQVQTNKARAVAAVADVVHSVDRGRLATALARGAQQTGRPLRVLVQVSLGAEPGLIGERGGADPADVPALADAVAALDGLVLGGVMAVAPRGAEPARAYARLAEIAAVLRADHPDATDVSAGMSGDLEAAVGAGATHVRVGTAVFGSRAPLQ